MALNQAWFLLASIIGFFLIVGVTYFVLRKRKISKPATATANLDRLTSLPEYQNRLSKYRLGLGLTATLAVVLVIVLSVLASKPVEITSTTPTKYSRDIVLCLDVSGSMYEVDEELLNKFQELTSEFKGERISLVVWNSKSYMVFPLTDDYDYINDNLEYAKGGFQTDPLTGEPKGLDFVRYTVNENGGSLIGDGLTACTLAFDQKDSQDYRSRSIILATDNVVNGEQLITLDESVQYATDEDITIYAINPITGFEETGTEAEQLKKSVEEINNGSYYPLTDPTATSGIVNQISAEEASLIESEPIITKNDVPQGWIFATIPLLALFFFTLRRFNI